MPKTPTRARLLSAARDLVAAGDGRLPSAGAVAARAGVSRLTVYHHFGSHAGLFRAVAESAHPAAAPPPEGSALERLRAAIEAGCVHWAQDTAFFRYLAPGRIADQDATARDLAAALGQADQLRPGCSLREAEDVIGILTSFASFDRLHHDGRRAPAAVADILFRMCGAILASRPLPGDKIAPTLATNP